VGLHAGQRSGILRFAANDSNTIVSVVSPVGTLRPRIGQRIMMFGKEIALRFGLADWRFANKSDYDEIGDATTERPQS
jgi:hypothetical protein